MTDHHRIRRNATGTAGVSAGFTLIELVVTLALVAVLVTIAVPSFHGIIVNNRIEAQSAEFAAELAFARTEAVRRGAPVVVCPTDAAGKACAGSSWNAPRLTFVDLEGDALSVDAADVLLRLSEAPSSQDSLSPLSPLTDVRFLSDGTAVAKATFEVCHPGFRGRVFMVRRLGSVSGSRPTEGAC